MIEMLELYEAAQNELDTMTQFTILQERHHDKRIDSLRGMIAGEKIILYMIKRRAIIKPLSDD